MITTFTIGCLGDFACQAIMRYRLGDDFLALERENLLEWSPTRTFRQGLVGMVFHALPYHIWLMKIVPLLTVSRKVVPSEVYNSVATFFWRMTVHTAVMSPYMMSSTFFGIGFFKSFSVYGPSVDAGVKMCRERFFEGF